MVDGQAGKGSKYRPVDPKKYAENWKKAFGKKKTTKKKGKKNKMYTIEKILNRSVSNWSKILGCSNEKTTTKPKKKAIKKKVNKEEHWEMPF